MSDPISALQDQLKEACDALGSMPHEIERLREENEELRQGCKFNAAQVERCNERILDLEHELATLTQQIRSERRVRWNSEGGG